MSWSTHTPGIILASSFLFCNKSWPQSRGSVVILWCASFALLHSILLPHHCYLLPRHRKVVAGGSDWVQWQTHPFFPPCDFHCQMADYDRGDEFYWPINDFNQCITYWHEKKGLGWELPEIERMCLFVEVKILLVDILMKGGIYKYKRRLER